MIRRAWDEFTGFPALMKVGLIVLAIGAALDILYHTAPLVWTPMLTLYLGEEGSRAHLITFLGMALTLAGVLTRARLHRRQAMHEERR